MAIHKLICAVKRSENPDLPEALFSPLIASFADEVAKKILETRLQENDIEGAERWKHCLIVDRDSELIDLFKSNVKNGSWWENLDSQGKRDHIWAFFSPGRPTDEVIEMLTLL